MGRRGPPPTPAAILQMRGSPRAVGRHEPAVDGTVPEPPVWLDNVARVCWDRTWAHLLRHGLADSADGNAVARYCRNWSVWSTSMDDIAEGGLTQKNDAGAEVDRPCVARAARYAELLSKAEQSFAMSPSARAQLGKGGGKPGDKEKGDDAYFGNTATA